ncbi:MAG TPA: hypothetical protein PK413_10855, partial [Thermoanaerobaculia bacterium]|nr:hypothetical protein [Thermoanaerobaculia bacterium]
ADHAFHTARFYVDRGTGDPLVRAEVSDLYATCCRLQQRYDKAIGLLHEAAASYAEVGDRHRVGRVLFKKTLVLFEMDHIAESSDLLERVVPLIDIEREPRLALNIQHQRTQALHQAGRSREALDLLPETRRLAEQYGSRIDRVRLTGVEGAIMTELGDFKLGEKCLREAIDGFLEEGIGYEAAFFSLELAALYLRQGRTGETRQLALEIAPIFESKDIHSEALAALMIFQKAAELEAANVTLAQEISRFLNRARHSPQLHYEPGT